MTIAWLETYQPLIVPIMLVLTIGLETIRPLAQSDHWWRHARRNLGISALTFIAFGALGVVKASSAAWVGSHHTGLLTLIAPPAALRILLSFLAIDLVDYVGHRFQHGVRWMWRFHRIHHSDPHLDATSSLRFHPFEAVVQVGYQTVAIFLFGIQLDAMVLFDTVLLALLFVQHGNINWPEAIDRPARLLFVTPDVHHVHHSREQRHTDSNFGDLFTIWDRLFGTYQEAADRRAIPYGLAEFDADRHHTVMGMALMPLVSVDSAGQRTTIDENRHAARV